MSKQVPLLLVAEVRNLEEESYFLMNQKGG
jgi:hypothetical protein